MLTVLFCESKQELRDTKFNKLALLLICVICATAADNLTITNVALYYDSIIITETGESTKAKALVDTARAVVDSLSTTGFTIVDKT
jgi:hypothetical protein